MVDSDALFPKSITIFNDANDFIFQKDKNSFAFNKEISTFKKVDFIPKQNSPGISVHTVIGMIEAKNYTYLLAAVKTKFVGSILTGKVFKIEEVQFISSCNQIHTEDSKYLKMILDFLNRNSLYYSDTLDLTIAMRTYANSITGNENKTNKNSYIFPYTLTNFCWNYTIARTLDFQGMEGIVCPIICGYFGMRSVSDYNEEISYIVIARKDNRRSGMRFLVRGSDRNGKVANYVETEEIVTHRDQEGKINIMSYVQVRGSIPLQWTQDPNLQLNPLIVPKDNYSENAQAFKMHMNEMINTYGKTVIVNLIDKKSDQKIIGDYYNNLAQDFKDSSKGNLNIPKIEYVWFDFHTECRKMRYENLKILLKVNSVAQGMNSFDYTHLIIDWNILYGENKSSPPLGSVLRQSDLQVVTKQQGVFRANCIDCLDRTNVVQTVFARFILHKMLHKIKLAELPNGDDAFELFKPVFEGIFKILWAEHGDHLSLSYSGTPALKSDFVRTGKRTIKGALMDGYLSCRRFWINNFVDGYNQDCHDYFLGYLNPRKTEFKRHSTSNVKVITPAVLLLSFALYSFLIGIAFPKEYEDNLKKKLLRLLIFAGVFTLTIKTVFGSVKKMLLDFPTEK